MRCNDFIFGMSRSAGELWGGIQRHVSGCCSSSAILLAAAGKKAAAASKVMFKYSKTASYHAFDFTRITFVIFPLMGIAFSKLNGVLVHHNWALSLRAQHAWL